MCNGRWGAQLEVALDDVIVLVAYLLGGGVQLEVALVEISGVVPN